MKKETKTVLVIADFAGLTDEQYLLTIKEVKKKFPNYLILPSIDKQQQEFESYSDVISYVYFVCEIQKGLFNEVKVVYYLPKKRVSRTILRLCFDVSASAK